ncbi:MAG: hypothetical protein ACAH59_05110 [Pseudobdellovibrionaceae bacterium]
MAPTWPQSANSSGSTSQTAYHFEVNGCSTGIHFIGASEPNVMYRMLCQALRDESRNKACAKQEREELFFESECENYL